MVVLLYHQVSCGLSSNLFFKIVNLTVRPSFCYLELARLLLRALFRLHVGTANKSLLEASSFSHLSHLHFQKRQEGKEGKVTQRLNSSHHRLSHASWCRRFSTPPRFKESAFWVSSRNPFCKWCRRLLRAIKGAACFRMKYNVLPTYI